MKEFKTLYYFSFIALLTMSGCGGGGGVSSTYNYNSNTPSSSPANHNVIASSTIISAEIAIDNSSCNSALPSDKNSTNYALYYLNRLRCYIGEDNLTLNSNLSNAALNHSKYMNETQEVGHYESNSNALNYTGYSPSDRVNNAVYNNTFIGENVSAGQGNYKESINGLMSAIYHRFGFLHLNINEIGIGKDSYFYTYDLGENGSTNSPEVVIWPPKDAKNISPVFFEESPDPLPDYSVSGYPVSVEFKNSATVDAFSLSDANSNNIGLITLMYKDNDPNNHFTDKQFAIFPKYRLDWGSKYYAHLQYKQNGTTYTKDWCFSTTSLNYYANRAYIIDSSNDTINLNIKSDESYAIYLKPRDKDDIYNGYSVTYTVSNLNINLIDGNTIYIKASGNSGNYVNIELKKGSDVTRRVNLTISSSDSATTPKAEVCP